MLTEAEANQLANAIAMCRGVTKATMNRIALLISQWVEEGDKDGAKVEFDQRDLV